MPLILTNKNVLGFMQGIILLCPLILMSQATAGTPGVASRAVPATLEGNYAGSFSGDDQGIFNISIKSDGTLVGLGYSKGDLANETISGVVLADGTITFGITSSGSTFTGTHFLDFSP